jgi:flavin-dependent dehydrogenase
MVIDDDKLYDCVIIGGGLAGLCLSIQLAKKGHSVVLIEKNTYPFHKVCGEYISMESWSFLESLGLPLSQMNLPMIDTIHVTAQNGYKISSPLTLGGFGISRHTLDHALAKEAMKQGVLVLDGCKVNNVKLSDAVYSIQTTLYQLSAKLVCGSYGKIEPAFIERNTTLKKGSYIGVKYHIKTHFPANLIELHNFKDGYCGISKVDKETYCLCYLTTVKNLRKYNNDIKLMEEHILMRNPHLKKYFSEAKHLFEKPLTISQISFAKKQTYHNDIVLLGDSAGAIAPLCGNGMSIAMRSSKILTNYITLFLNAEISKAELISNYENEWNMNFALRIKSGFYLQKLFGKHLTTLWSLKLLNTFPTLFKKVISLTHGKPF